LEDNERATKLFVYTREKGKKAIFFSRQKRGLLRGCSMPKGDFFCTAAQGGEEKILLPGEDFVVEAISIGKPRYLISMNV